MPPAMVTATVPHRARTAERPDRVVPLVPQIVAYLCGACEVTTEARLHPRAPIPVLWPCRICRRGRRVHGGRRRGRRADRRAGRSEAVSAQGPLGPTCPSAAPRQELERLLTKRLELLRAGKLHSGPSHQ